LDIGMLWLLVDLPFLIAWCVVDRRRWRLHRSPLLALLWSVRTVDRSRPEGERDNRYNAQALFIAELGLLPIQLAKPKRMTVLRISTMVLKS
jgi:hypothetical protein